MHDDLTRFRDSMSEIGDCTLVVNTFERSFRDVLNAHFFDGVEAQNLGRFSSIVVLLNNIEARDEANFLARALLASNRVDDVRWVEDELSMALSAVQLNIDELDPCRHYSDCCIVAPFVVHTRYLLYWDVDITLRAPARWVDEGIALLESDSSIMVVSPTPHRREMRQFARRVENVELTYGFSDQVFLARTDDLRQPVYGERCIASLRFPLSHVVATAEQRLDAWMRNHGRYRALIRNATYVHEGVTWYWPTSFASMLLFVRNRMVSRLLKLQPLSNEPRWRI